MEDFVYILVFCEAQVSDRAWVLNISSSATKFNDNTMWAGVNFFGQMTIQRYFVFVSTVELRTLYIQKLPYMNTFCEYILKKIGPTHTHFQYTAVQRKDINAIVKVRFTMM